MRGNLETLHCCCLRSCPMYTNPSDYYMALMKDDGSSRKLVDLWHKADHEWVATPRITPPPPTAFFASGKVPPYKIP